MPIRSASPYKSDVYTLKRYGSNIVKISYCHVLREAGWEDEREQKKKGSVNAEKLDNNLSRAKGTVRELALCNDWDYWVTLTVSPEKYNRYDLEKYRKDLAEFIHNYNRRSNDTEKVKYLLVPEKCKDGAWHMHGFIRGIRPKDLFVNEHGYLDWKQYKKKFGFISMEKLRNKEKCASYILKYLTKDTEKTIVEINAHLYYASNGLKRAEEIYRGSAVFHGQWDWIHPDGYCKVKNVDIRRNALGDFITLE